jgi:hypothetical protein
VEARLFYPLILTRWLLGPAAQVVLRELLVPQVLSRAFQQSLPTVVAAAVVHCLSPMQTVAVVVQVVVRFVSAVAVPQQQAKATTVVTAKTLRVPAGISDAVAAAVPVVPVAHRQQHQLAVLGWQIALLVHL